MTNVVVSASGTYETGEVINDTIPANPGDAGAEVVGVIDVVDSTFVGNYTMGFGFLEHYRYFGCGWFILAKHRFAIVQLQWSNNPRTFPMV
jgi:hypothetical protein